MSQHLPEPPEFPSASCVIRQIMTAGWSVYLRTLSENLLGDWLPRSRQVGLMLEASATVLAAFSQGNTPRRSPARRGSEVRSAVPTCPDAVAEQSAVSLIATAVQGYFWSQVTNKSDLGLLPGLLAPVVAAALIDGLVEAFEDWFEGDTIRTTLTYLLEEAA